MRPDPRLNKWPRDERIFAFSLRLGAVYTAVERIQISPPEGNGSRANAGHCSFGTERRWSSSPHLKCRIRNSSDRNQAAVSKPYHYCLGSDKQKDVGVAKADAPSY